MTEVLSVRRAAASASVLPASYRAKKREEEGMSFKTATLFDL